MSRAWIALVIASLAPLSADAVPRVPRRAAPRPPPRPTLTLQLAGLNPGPSRGFTAVLHALRRDALLAFETCVSAHPEARGVATLRLTPARRGRVEVSVSSGFAPTLTQCLRAAAERVELPPEELDETPDETADAPVRFELRVRLPAVGLR